MELKDKAQQLANKLIDYRISRIKLLGGEVSETIAVHNPATMELVAEVPLLSVPQIHAACNHAANFFIDYSKRSPTEKHDQLCRIAARILLEKETLAALITLEQGKSIKEAMVEVEYSAAYFNWYAKVLQKDIARSVLLPDGTEIKVSREPVGVTAAITPWNFPLAMLARKVSASIAAGCPMVVKPALETPLSAFAIEQIIEEFSGSPFLLQTIPADAQTAADIIFSFAPIRKVSFTGSTATGKKLIQQSANQVKRLTLELGGNAPFIVCEGADLEHAASEAVFTKFRNSGQTCIAVNRFLIQKSIFEPFAKLFTKKVSELQTGNGFNPATNIGPLIHSAAAQKANRILSDAKQKGVQILYEGVVQSSDSSAVDTSNFLAPIVGIVSQEQSNTLAAWNEEIFAPIGLLYPFADLDDAVRKANSVSVGLASYIFTNSASEQNTLCRGLQFGMVGVNTGRISRVESPFGGIKESGFGREGGLEGIEEYQSIKSCVIGS